MYVKEVAKRLGDSRFLPILSRYYASSPSVVLIRTAEAELLSAISLDAPVLDLACGDGFFSGLICPDGMDAGCDFSEIALNRAAARKLYKELAWADITKEIPFPSASFQTVLSNSSLEHVADIDAVLIEIARVLKPGGRLVFTLGSNYCYEWWPLSEKTKKQYLGYQPVYSYFTLQEWESRLNAVGLSLLAHQYYLTSRATKVLMWMDYHFSRASMTSEKTFVLRVIQVLRMIPQPLLAWFWRRAFAGFHIRSDDTGGGIMIVSDKTHKLMNTEG